jgi:hypothetical protein
VLLLGVVGGMRVQVVQQDLFHVSVLRGQEHVVVQVKLPPDASTVG